MNNNFNHDEELYHYGVKGMKWGVRRNTLSSAASRRIKKMGEKRTERSKEVLAPRDPITKQRIERSKERAKRRREMDEIVQAKGKDKVYKILQKIGNDLMNPVIIDAPTTPKRQPWDEKRDPDYRGGRI